jgi:hypothetical protein
LRRYYGLKVSRFGEYHMTKDEIGFYRRPHHDVFIHSWEGFSTVERTNVLPPITLPRSNLVVLRWYKNPDKPNIQEIVREMNISDVLCMSSKVWFAYTEMSSDYSRLIANEGVVLAAILECHLPDNLDWDEGRYLRIVAKRMRNIVGEGEINDTARDS